MGIIQFRCDDSLVLRMSEAAARVGLTPAEFGRALFERVLPVLRENSTSDSEESDDLSNEVYEARSKRLYARLTPTEYAGVHARARAYGMTPYTWTMRLIRTHLTLEPQLNGEEVWALREATRELSYVGRNLNQVARAVNLDLNAREKVTKELVKEVNAIVKIQQDRIKAVLDQNVNRWGVK